MKKEVNHAISFRLLRSTFRLPHPAFRLHYSCGVRDRFLRPLRQLYTGSIGFTQEPILLICHLRHHVSKDKRSANRRLSACLIHSTPYHTLPTLCPSRDDGDAELSRWPVVLLEHTPNQGGGVSFVCLPLKAFFGQIAAVQIVML